MKNYKNTDDYIASQPQEYREGLERLRSIILKAAPKATEVISYGMPAFKQNRVLVYFALAKKHYGFYPTSKPIVVFAKELKNYKTSKGAIQFPLDKPFPVKLITDIVKFRIKEGAVKNKK